MQAYRTSKDGYKNGQKIADNSTNSDTSVIEKISRDKDENTHSDKMEKIDKTI